MGLGGLGLLVWRRKRKAQAVAVKTRSFVLPNRPALTKPTDISPTCRALRSSSLGWPGAAGFLLAGTPAKG
jgi:hypothetical protein